MEQKIGKLQSYLSTIVARFSYVTCLTVLTEGQCRFQPMNMSGWAEMGPACLCGDGSYGELPLATWRQNRTNMASTTILGQCRYIFVQLIILKGMGGYIGREGQVNG